MVKVNFIGPESGAAAVEASPGHSLMQAAMTLAVDGIVAECGGNAMCATCHVYVADDWLAALPPMDAGEDALLDGTAAERTANSRLSCQIIVRPALDGLTVTIPDRQY